MEYLKRFFRLWPALAFALAFAGTVWAQEAAEVGNAADLTRNVMLVIANLTPIVVHFAKQFLPPELSPFVAAVVGGVGTMLINVFTGTAIDPVIGTLAGSAGVGVREGYDQTKKALGMR